MNLNTAKTAKSKFHVYVTVKTTVISQNPYTYEAEYIV